ncbi:MAG: pyridoxal phosphate-dependent aminotransferase family protein [Chitinophagales bacterium]|nr:pyridoxal phosphate-dependent aminotransferase family protein [Bacteroidota bacterium]
MNIEDRIGNFLEERKQNKLYRSLKLTEDLVDFSSNDYLGLARSAFIRQQVDLEYQQYKHQKTGATGSRLLNGNSSLYEEIEEQIAQIHHAEAALIFNSGFDANVGLLSTVARKDDIIFYDESIHASLHQGIKLSGAESKSFAHQNYADLEAKLSLCSPEKVKFIVSESVFSMKGDKADLKILAHFAQKYKANLIVDEAHATGIFGEKGSGLCRELEMENACFARIYTFGKAIGSHGAAVVGSRQLKDYLINFSKNFIYTTALSTPNLLSVKHSYFFIQNNVNQLNRLFNLINFFKSEINSLNIDYKILGEGPVFCLLVSGNENCRDFAAYFQANGLDLRPILSPTVPKGQELIRIVLHSYNTELELNKLFSLIVDYK